ncbi:PemK-like protein [Gordonia hirsuta DSM 44140 = NBRC 16056]|uniref:PemK-like protein n=1 Tax=Gordonia hirsuta DSM 44140 = NBRC 16056 TaxID=1121927 RepID=L7L8G2_9ACTN|nr:type II toxin-antitoxin system PemK/MazF family toxin [Gordonia hirsuta]GAC57214.1 PemK-like protein [Gordonia hirsuta DSM 44140 = NBRC 16056]
MSTAEPLAQGSIVWVEFDSRQEQGGRRPAVIVAGDDYLEVVNTRLIVVPVTSVDRGWPSRVEVTGGDLGQPSWAMTEQIRTVSRSRVVDRAGSVDAVTLRQIRTWVRDFLDRAIR